MTFGRGNTRILEGLFFWKKGDELQSPPAAGLKVVIYIHCCLLNLSQHLHSSWWLTQWQDSFIHTWGPGCRVLLRLWLLCALFTTKMGKLVLEAILRQRGITWVPNICLPSPTAGTVPPSHRDQDQISLQQSCCCLVPWQQLQFTSQRYYQWLSMCFLN